MDFVNTNGMGTGNSKYELKDSLMERLQSVINRYKSHNILIIAHSILLANYIGKFAINPGGLIDVTDIVHR